MVRPLFAVQVEAVGADPISMMGSAARRGAALLFSLAMGCSGVIGDAPGGDPGGSGGDGASAATGGTGGIAPPAPSTCPKGPQPGTPVLLRLTNQQYRNTLNDLFSGITMVPDAALPGENYIEGFNTNGGGQTSTLGHLEIYHSVAKQLGSYVAANAVATVAPCANGASEDSCADAFIKSWGKKVFRRPLAADEAMRLSALYRSAKASSTHAIGIGITLEAMLLAPQFLFRLEQSGMAAVGQPIALGSHEIASRLSYLLWDTMPDSTLMAAADGDRLRTPEGIETEARRLMGNARAKTVVARFHTQWLRLGMIDNDLEKDRKTYPTWAYNTGSDMGASVDRFVDYAFWSDGKLATLLTDNHAHVNGQLAAIYGVPAPAAGTTGFALVETPPGQRAGILTQAGIMAALAKTITDSPVHRGVFVLDHLLCTQIPDPPADIPPLPEPRVGEPARTTRQRVEQSHSNPTCAACHKMIDGIGFGFENYDAIGRYRTKENGIAVDSSGEFVGTDIDGRFDGAVDMGRKLAKSGQVMDCVAKQWFRYGFGRVEAPADACALSPIQDGFRASGGDMKGLLLTMVKSDAFRYRSQP